MTQYLILHKVRGESAFDIAEQIEVSDESDELIWIISTSGHRAYPYRKWPLSAVLVDNFRSVTNFKDHMPDDWPDHYQPTDLPASKGMGRTLDISKILEARLPRTKRRM